MDNTSRDQLETDFFTQAPWNDLPESQLGVDALKSRLDRLIYSLMLGHILPAMKEIIQADLSEHKKKLEMLDQQSLEEQRAYLIGVSQRLTNILRDAVRGDYPHQAEGTDTNMNIPGRPLRSVVRNNLAEFSQEMHDRGCSLKVVANGVEIKDDEGSAMKQISRSDYAAQVQEML